jgi:hypothetical protein
MIPVAFWMKKDGIALRPSASPNALPSGVVAIAFWTRFVALAETQLHLRKHVNEVPCYSDTPSYI